MSWTKEDTQKLIELANRGMYNDEIAIELDKTESSVRAKAYRMGIEIRCDYERAVDSSNVLCPFFLRYGKDCVYCEAWNSGGVIRTHFPEAKCFSEFVQKMCQNKYKECGLYSAIEKKYDE